ncbi:MucBP domain-containing protein, partial [Loigolactobacillus bifermentans]
MFKKVNEYNEKVHFKMYKKGKTWVYAGIAIVSLAVGVSQRQVTPVQAASVATTAATSSAATTQVNSSTAASTAGQAVATATTTNQASSATSAQSDAKPTVSQAGTTTAQVASSAASADKTTATTAANNVVTDQTTTATATTSTDYASSAAAASTASTDTAQVSNTRTTSDLPASATSASSAATSNGTVSSSTAAIATPAATTTSQTPVASSAADDVVYQSPQTKSLQDAGTTTTMPDGFSVSDPDHPDWVYAEPADSDWYTFAQMNTVSFEINRTDMTTVRVGMVAGTSGQLTINNFQTLPTASNDVQALKYGELTIFNNLDSIYVVGTLSSIYDVLQYPNGTKGSYSGYGFFKPVQQTQTTRYVDKNGNEIASAVEMTGLSGQKYETVPSADLVGYTPTDSGNTKGTMSPWTENGQTKSQIIYNTDFTKKGEIIYTVKDVNTGEITFTTPGSTTAPSGTDLIYGGDAGKAFGSYNVKNPYIPQTTNITYTYDAEKVPVTINYVDQNNQVIQAPTTTDIDYQATDAIDHPAIAGYTYDSSYTATATDNPADYTVTSLTNNTVTLHYQANPEQVTIQHVDENGTPIANVPDTVIATKFNATLALDGTTDSSYTISGYELDATASNPTTYQVVDGENTVVLHYVQQQPVTVNYVDQNGQLLDQNPATTLQGIVGETLPITSPTITGYTAYTDNPTQYTVTAGDNQVTLHYIQTKIPVSVALAAGTTDTLVFHDATGHVIERGGLVDSSATNGPKWPTTLAADGLTGAKTSTDANRNDMVRVVTENVYTYDQSGAEVPMSVELAYFTRTATVDFSDPAQPTVTYDGAWTAAQGAQTVTAALNTDYLPSLDYVLAHEIYNLPADEQAFAFDQKGNAIALATVALGGKSAQVVPAQQVTADTANFNVYVVYAKTTNLTKTYTRTVHFVDQSGTQISPDVVQTVTYTRTPILDTTNPTAPTVSQYTDWTTTNATFAQVDAAAVTGQFALTSAVPATQVAATETTLNTDATIVYVDATQTVQVNYVGTPAGYQPTQTSVTGTVNTTTTLTPDVIAGYQADATSYPVSFAIDAIGALVTPTITVTYTPKTVNGSVDLTATGLATPEEQALLENIPVTGQTGAVIQVAVPAVTGYTTTQTTTTVTVNPDGTITPNETIVYTPDQVTQDVTIETNQGPKTVVGVTGTVDNVIDVTVPEVPGYSSDKETVPATVNPDGTITVDKDTGTVTYTPTTHDYSITPVDKNGDPIPGTTATPKTGTTDTTIDSDTYPEVPGYTAETTEVNVPTGDTSVNVV